MLGGSQTARRLVAVACAFALPACGGDDKRVSERDRVVAYIESVNAVQEEMAPLLNEASDVYARFARGELPPREAEEAMRRNQLTVAAIRGRVDALPAPPPARDLRLLLIAFYEAGDGMAEQTRLMARYLPAQRRALLAFRREGERLRRGLRASGSDPEAQARALSRYGSGLLAVIERVSRLRPPLILIPARDAELRRLGESREIARGLRAAVEDRDQVRVLRLLDRFQTVNLREADRAARRAAQRAYQGYVEAINDAESEVRAELRRLDARTR